MSRSNETRAPHAEARDLQTRRARIRELNDQFRISLTGGRVMMTSGIRDLGPVGILHVVNAVRTFADFSNDNDPHAEHDFGSVEVAGERVFWKIDYYDHRYQYGSPDPSLPGLTGRVLTIMLASEY